jgi:hypothetical protein
LLKRITIRRPGINYSALSVLNQGGPNKNWIIKEGERQGVLSKDNLNNIFGARLE